MCMAKRWSSRDLLVGLSVLVSLFISSTVVFLALLRLVELAVNIIHIFLVMSSELSLIQEGVLVLVKLVEVLLSILGSLLIHLCWGEVVLLNVLRSIKLLLHVFGDFTKVGLAVFVTVHLGELFLSLLGWIV